MPNNPQQAKLTHQHFVKDYVSDQVLEANVFLNRMKSSGKIRYNIGGTKIGEGVERLRQHSVTGWSAMKATNVSQPDLHENWSQQWAGFICQFFIDEWDVLANKGHSEALFDMQREYEESMLEDLNEYMEDSLFLDRSSSNPPQWQGLAGFMKKTGTYLGLSQASGDAVGNKRKAFVVGGGSSAKPSHIASSFKTDPTPYLTHMLTQTTRGKTKSKRNQVDFFITTRSGWERIHAKIESIRRVIVERNMQRIGHQNFMWNGVPVFWSDSCPANTLYGINSNYLELYCQTPKILKDRTYESNQPIGMVFQSYHKGNIVCRQPRNMTKLSTSHIG